MSQWTYRTNSDILKCMCLKMIYLIRSCLVQFCILSVQNVDHLCKNIPQILLFLSPVARFYSFTDLLHLQWILTSSSCSGDSCHLWSSTKFHKQSVSFLELGHLAVMWQDAFWYVPTDIFHRVTRLLGK